MTLLRTNPAPSTRLDLPARIDPDLAARRVVADHDRLLRTVEGRTDFELSARDYAGSAPPNALWDSLHDLLALMIAGDEVALGMLHEADRGRTHWALDDECETRDVRRRLDSSGVAAGRVLPAWLLLHRLVSVRDALDHELRSVDQRLWRGALGAAVEDALTADGASPFRRAGHHLCPPLTRVTWTITTKGKTDE